MECPSYSLVKFRVLFISWLNCVVCALYIMKDTLEGSDEDWSLDFHTWALRWKTLMISWKLFLKLLMYSEGEWFQTDMRKIDQWLSQLIVKGTQLAVYTLLWKTLLWINWNISAWSAEGGAHTDMFWFLIILVSK